MYFASILSQRLLVVLVTASLAAPVAGQPSVETGGYAAGLPPYGQSPAAASSAQEADSAVQVMDECVVLARIDGEIVQASEVLWLANDAISRKLQDLPPQQRSNIPPEQLIEARNGIIQRILADLANRKLLLADFRRSVPDAATRMIDIEQRLAEPFEEQNLPRFMEQLEVSTVQELELKLAELGTSLEMQRRAFTEEMVAANWLGTNTESKYDKTVTPDELLAYYTEHIAEYQFPTQARWEELMVRFDRFANPKDAYDAICQMGNNAYLAAAQNPGFRGPAFADIARAGSHGFTASEGGIQDWTIQGSLKSEAIDRALFTLEVGQMSDVLPSEQGYHIVRVLERREAGREPFTKVQAAIRDKIMAERAMAVRLEFLEELRRNAQIWTAFAGNISYEQLASLPGGPEQR